MLDEFDEVETYSTAYDSAQPLKFAEDFGDPSLDTVLHWHIRVCHKCSQGVAGPPLRFGESNRSRFCTDYFEIIGDYAEYDGRYAMRGNP
jgi:hypothetical protein